LAAELRDYGAERAERNKVTGLWTTLGYELKDWTRGTAAVGWNATPEYGFATASGYVVQGGLVTTLLDSAMAASCWTVLDTEHGFLTADLRVEFLRSARVGPLVATGSIVHITRRVAFCAGELHDADGKLLATSRCTQVILDQHHPSTRTSPAQATETA
jgi:uncharacterized protein (TIGR00369 family)